jgi:hypothetical protein
MVEQMILPIEQGSNLLPSFIGSITPDMLTKAYQIECSCAGGDDNPY